MQSTGPEKCIFDIINGQLPAVHLPDLFSDAGGSVIIAFSGNTFTKSGCKPFSRQAGAPHRFGPQTAAVDPFTQ